jgi:hypothetical protein
MTNVSLSRPSAGLATVRVSSRVAATLYATQHGLMGTFESAS